MRSRKYFAPLIAALTLCCWSSIALAQQAPAGSEGPAAAGLDEWIDWSQSAPSSLPDEPPPIPLPPTLVPTPALEVAPPVEPDQPAATTAPTTTKTDWRLPLGAAGGCAACTLGGCLVWLPMALPIGMLFYGASLGSMGQGWAILAFVVGILIAPVSGVALLIDEALSPVAVALGAGIDARFALDRWWPAAVGAAAGWVVLAGGLGLAVLSVTGASVLLTALPFASVLYVVGLGASALAIYLTAPAALAGAIAGDLLWNSVEFKEASSARAADRE